MTRFKNDDVGRLFKKWKSIFFIEVAYYSFDGVQEHDFLIFWKRFQAVLLFTIFCLLKFFTILCEIWTIKRQQMAKISNREVYMYDSTSKFQE